MQTRVGNLIVTILSEYGSATISKQGILVPEVLESLERGDESLGEFVERVEKRAEELNG